MSAQEHQEHQRTPSWGVCKYFLYCPLRWRSLVFLVFPDSARATNERMPTADQTDLPFGIGGWRG